MYISRITDHIFQGGQHTGPEFKIMRDQYRFTHVLSCNGPDNIHQIHVRMIFGDDNVLVLPWRDDFQEKPLADFARIQQWYQEMIRNPDWRVFVHCSAGINRSTIGTMWLLMLQGMEEDAAYRLILQGRPIAQGWSVPAYRLSVIRARYELLEHPTMAKGKKKPAAPKLAPKAPAAPTVPAKKPKKK